VIEEDKSEPSMSELNSEKCLSEINEETLVFSLSPTISMRKDARKRKNKTLCLIFFFFDIYTFVLNL